ncbi:hypothetical protein CY658_04800 [Variovorax sp. RO1]|uniref:hypothetical protein n=1 Tax=Variovorax sp. RO1 TaxID=2066034 RepID=UPI000C717AC5|nr:hypothetical protein [Variovorax sp. RO1]PLC06355.1 hypothetical protein CY658_04800 [Variovorax sp. RO1]
MNTPELSTASAGEAAQSDCTGSLKQAPDGSLRCELCGFTVDTRYHKERRPAPGRAPLTVEPAITWPKTRDVGRCGDMTPTGQSVLRVGMDSDNDVFVEVWDCGGRDRAEDFQIASLEFCTGGAGGGKSMRTRIALINLMTAMEADNAETPHKAWPAVSGIAPAGGIGGEKP